MYWRRDWHRSRADGMPERERYLPSTHSLSLSLPTSPWLLRDSALPGGTGPEPRTLLPPAHRAGVDPGRWPILAARFRIGAALSLPSVSTRLQGDRRRFTIGRRAPFENPRPRSTSTSGRALDLDPVEQNRGDLTRSPTATIRECLQTSRAPSDPRKSEQTFRANVRSCEQTFVRTDVRANVCSGRGRRLFAQNHLLPIFSSGVAGTARRGRAVGRAGLARTSLLPIFSTGLALG